MANENKIGRPSKGGRNFNSVVAERIREITNGETQQEIADRSEISRQAAGRIINGQNNPDIDTLLKIAQAYNVSADYLLGLSDVKSSDTTVKDICAVLKIDEDTLATLAYIVKMRSTTFAEFVKEGHLFAILNDIATLQSTSEDMLEIGKSASNILDANSFYNFDSERLNAIRYQAFSHFERMMDKYDVRITKEDEISKIKQAIADIFKEQVKDNFQETLKEVQEYHRRKNNGTNRTEKE